MNLGTHNTHLNKKETFGIRQGAYGSFQIQAENFHPISQVQIGCFQAAGSFLLFDGNIFLDLCHFLAELLPFGFHFLYRNICLAELMEILHSLICVFFGFSENGMCLFVCLLNNTFLPLIQFFLFGFQLRLQCMNFLFILFNFQTFFFNGHSVCFQSGDYIFKGFILFTDLFFRFIDDIRRQPQFSGNSKRITFSRYSDQKAIGGAKCLHIKFTGRIFYAWCRQCIYFQFTVMGCRHGADPLFLQMIQNSNCQCGSFSGVSTGT